MLSRSLSAGSVLPQAGYNLDHDFVWRDRMASPKIELSSPARLPLRTSLPILQGLDLQARYHAPRTGGDFYDALAVGHHVLFMLSDIAGRRAEAHPIASEMQDVFRSSASKLFGKIQANASEAIALLAHDVNGALTSAAQGTRFTPTFLGCYSLPFGILTYINAGGQTALFRDSDGTRTLESGGMPLGLFTHMTYEPAMQAFEPGARLLLVTKGVIEGSPGSTDFGVTRLSRLLQDTDSESAQELCHSTLQTAQKFKKRRWSGILKPRFKPELAEDLTAVAMVRPPRIPQIEVS
jgi:serine phosphatase RsbU (regulator of sigma subunit)